MTTGARHSFRIARTVPQRPGRHVDQWQALAKEIA